MFPLPSVVELMTFRLSVSGVDGDIKDAVGMNTNAGVLECEYNSFVVLAKVHMS
jgi:hypothetical protein